MTSSRTPIRVAVTSSNVGHRCRRWYRWWVSQSRTPIRVAVTSSNVGHDVKCKRTIGGVCGFSVSAKASHPISFSTFPFLFLSLPLPFPSSSSPFDLSFALQVWKFCMQKLTDYGPVFKVRLKRKYTDTEAFVCSEGSHVLDSRSKVAAEFFKWRI